MNPKNILIKFTNFLIDKHARFNYLVRMGATNHISDERFLKMKYSRTYGKELKFDIPITFNEKLQWLKLYDRNPNYTVMVDKYKVRDYIAEKIGAQYLTPLVGVWDSPDKIDFEALPDQFVLKCNHNSGFGMCICTDKSKIDITKVKKGLAKGLKQDYYLTGREWPYKDVPRKIVAEQFLKSDVGGLTDYKIHCFNGIPKFVLVCRDRFAESGLTEDFYTLEWEHMNLKRPKIPNALTPIPKPEKLDEMLELAKKLSENIPFIRVDFYLVEGKIYFSELTFFPASGFEGYDPPEWDKTFGEWLSLPLK
ncbi:MAG: glycosyl transferase [Ruminococcaceae bacterium]|nr:glycosyl transferase [Oscillospiraceae bacterium]